MNNTLYPKLAVTNLKNNRKTYVPYIFTAVLCVMMFYMIDALSRSESVEEVTMQICLRYAVAVVMIFRNGKIAYIENDVDRNAHNSRS